MAYKARKRSEKVEKSKSETIRIKQQPIQELKVKDYLSVNEVSKLIGVSRRTVYRLIEQGELKKIKIGSRTIIKRSALNSFIESAETGKTKITETQKQETADWKQAGEFEISDCYTISEILEKFSISETALHSLIKSKRIPKIKKGRYAYVPKTFIDELLT